MTTIWDFSLSSALTWISGDEDEKNRSSSPVYELLRPIPLRPVPLRFEHAFIKSEETVSR